MSASVVGICNSALIKIGSERINSLSDNNKRAILCNEQYSKLRDEVLRAHPWNFAIKRAELSLLVDTPEYGWDFKFQLPTDCLKVLETENDEPYTIEGRELLANVDELNFKYIYQNLDTSSYDSIFQEALACRIAVDLAMAITQSKPMVELMMAAYNAQLKLARSMDAQEGTPEGETPSTWTQVRL